MHLNEAKNCTLITKSLKFAVSNYIQTTKNQFQFTLRVQRGTDSEEKNVISSTQKDYNDIIE